MEEIKCGEIFKKIDFRRSKNFYIIRLVDIFFEESKIKIRISKKILSRKRQTIRKDRTQSFGFKAIHCYDCQNADFLIIKGKQFFVFSEVLAEAFSYKNK